MATSTSKHIIVIAGPTAVGKTEAAIQIGKYFNAEIFSCDSRQVYKEMTIGTAKPSVEELDSIPHHFINHISITEDYSAGKYSREFREAIEQYFTYKDIAILCGGTGFYMKAALEGIDDFPDIPRKIKEKWKQLFKAEGLEYLQNYLRKHDPIYSAKVDMQNTHRLLRAAEVIDVSNNPFSFFLKDRYAAIDASTHKIQLIMDREALYNRINLRVWDMIEKGLVEEVKSLIDFAHLTSMDTVGYREIISFLNGEITLEDAVALIKRNSRRYAKRQITWFNNQDSFIPFAYNDIEGLITFLEKEME